MQTPHHLAHPHAMAAAHLYQFPQGEIVALYSINDANNTVYINMLHIIVLLVCSIYKYVPCINLSQAKV
jgi:hypothetical protein